MDDIDKRVGANLKEFRGSMSQAVLAGKMTDKGFKWSQATVYEVERGARPLKLSEAITVARIIDVDLERLWADSHWSRTYLEARKAYFAWQNELETVLKAREEFEVKRRFLGDKAYQLMQLTNSSDPFYGQFKDMARLSKLNFDDAIREYERLKKDQALDEARWLIQSEGGGSDGH